MMKKIFLTFVFAGFATLAVSAQTEPTASNNNNSATNAKKEHCAGMAKACSAEEKAACAKETKSCCAKGSAKTAMTDKNEKADVKKAPVANR